MRVVLLGGSGFIGRHLAPALKARGDDVAIASLRDIDRAVESASDCDAIVNLTGEPVDQRWTAEAKRRIEHSRVELPRQFLERLAQRPHRCTIYVSASAIGYYGTSETQTFDEESPAGEDFLARVCVGWEREARRAEGLGMRVAIVRTGVALGSDGGALAKMLPPFRAGVAGRIGSGRQWISWVHVDDVVGVYLMALDHESEPLNATAPNPVTNATLTKSLGDALKRPTKLAVPTIALRMMLGEGADILLTGQRVLPRRTQERGYRFKFVEFTAALANLL
jgi:uncharacterized protein (TIGR01777 family)